MANIANDISTSTAKAVELTGEVMNELVNVVLHAVGGVVESVNTVTSSTGDIADNVIGNTIGVKVCNTLNSMAA